MFRDRLLGTTSLLEESTGTGTGDPDDAKKAQDKKWREEATNFNLASSLSNPYIKQTIDEYAEREIAKPLKTKNGDLLDKLVKYKVKNEKGEESYIDAEAAIDALKKVKEGLTPDMRKEVERAVSEANSRKDAEIKRIADEKAKAEELLGKETSRRHQLLMDHSLRSALVESGIKTGKLPLHENFLRSKMAIMDENGKEVVVVISDDDGKPRYGSKGLMTVAEFVNEYRNKDGVAEDWSPTTRGGTGTGPNVTGRPGGAVDQNLPPTDRLKIFRRSQNRV